jgi:N-methylhydantoinase A
MEPTVTDANLVLGRLGADSRLGGELALDPDAAERAIADKIAGPLDLDLVAAASGILRVANATMARGVRVVSVERGHDPRRLTLVPFGGAGPMHGSPLARDLGIPRLLVPPTPGILCALGMLVADLRHDLVQTHLAPHAALSLEQVTAIFEPMLAEARRLLTEDRVSEDRWRIEMRLEMRYIGQSYELPIPLNPSPSPANSSPSPASGGGLGWGLSTLNATTLAQMAAAFHAEHARRFGHSDPKAPIEIVSFGVTATGLIDTPELPRPAQGDTAPPADARRGTRRAFFEGTNGGSGGWAECPVWQREKLLAGNDITGPALIEEISATTVLYPGDRAHVDAIGSLIVEVGA